MNKLRGVDVVGTLLSGACLLEGLVVVVLQPTYMKMFRDFGTGLPWLTQLFLQPLPVLLLAVLPGVLVLEGVVRQRSEAAQVGRCVAAMVVAALLLVGFLAAMYAPLFFAADSIGP